jgi:hypothetical protein
MAKSYTEELAEWAQQRPRAAARHKSLAAFLRVKDDVRQAVDQGWPVRAIWAHLCEQKRISFGYQTFLNHVKRNLRQDAGPARATSRMQSVTNPSPAPPHHARGSAGPAVRATASSSNGHDQIRGFIHNPVPNLKELI